MSMNNWSRLTNEIYRKVKEKTGNEELALALGWGAMATLPGTFTAQSCIRSVAGGVSDVCRVNPSGQRKME